MLCQLADAKIKTPVEIWAYGSRVDGSAHEGSDLDLVIRTENLNPLPIGELRGFIEAVSASNIPILVQIFDWGRIPPSFQQRILAGYEVLHTICKG